MPDVNFKPKQVQCFERLLMSRDVIGVFPTGFGKSLIFQLLPDFFNGGFDIENYTVLVISPLNSIIKDQMNTLKRYGISSFSFKEREIDDDTPDTIFKTAIQNQNSVDADDDSFEHGSSDNKYELPKYFTDCEVKVIFAHPEAILGENGKDILRTNVFQRKIKACIVDETHCIELW